MIRIIVFISTFFSLLFVYGQNNFTGIVVDSLTNEPIPFVKVLFLHSTQGGITDFDGNFNIRKDAEKDSVRFSSVGYNPKTICISRLDSAINIQIFLGQSTMLNTVEVLAGKNPAFKVLKAINAHRAENDPSNLEAYQYEVYTKLQFDIKNLEDDFSEKGYMKKFQFIKGYVDTLNHVNSLPILLSESISDVYYKSNPAQKKEVINATHITGIDNLNLTQFTEDMNKEIDVYQNYYSMFGKDFLSPIAPTGRAFYDYTILACDTLNDQKCIHLSFQPKRKGDALFIGDIWVTEKNYAVKKLQVAIPKNVNLNYISNFSVLQNYTVIDSSVLMVTNAIVNAEFKLMNESKRDRLPNILVQKTASKSKLTTNKPKDFSFYAGTIILADSAENRTQEYWNNARHDTLTTQQAGVIEMIDSLKKNKTFVLYDKITRFGLSGYWETGKIELGYLYSLYNKNEVEGPKLMVKLRTSNTFSKTHKLNVYGIYGFTDKAFKYGVSYDWLINNSPSKAIHVSYSKRVEQLSLSNNLGNIDNSFTTLFSTTKQNKLTLTDKVKFSFNRTYISPFRTENSLEWRKLTPVGITAYQTVSTDGDTIGVRSLSTFEIKNSITFSKNERFITVNSRKLSLGSEIPVITFSHTLGIKDMFGSKHNYNRFDFVLAHRPKLGAFGKLRYAIYAGKIVGKVPFPLLNTHSGNETHYMQIKTFNLLNYYEFVSDTWVGINYQHQLQGLIMDRIPLLNKLKWRLVYGAKAMVGNYNPATHSDLILPSYSKSMSFTKPYVETNIGIENIFKVLRVDAIWRLSYLDNPNATKFGVKFRFVGNF